MKFTVKQELLNEKLALVSRAVPAKPTHPILGFILLEAQKSLTLKGFDLSMGIKSEIPATVDEWGSVCLPAGLLSAIVGKLPSDCMIQFDYDVQNQSMNIVSPYGKYSLRGQDSDEYPDFPFISDKQLVVLSSETLQRGLNATVGVASREEAKQILQGVSLLVKNNKMEFASTDGHRLALFKTDVESFDFHKVVKHNALTEVLKILNNDCSVKWDDSLISLESGSDLIIARLLDGTYPNYNQLIPTEFERKVTVNSKQLKSALDRVTVFLDSKNSMVKWEMIGDELILSSVATEVGQGKERLSIDYSGDDYAIGFNYRYLIDALKGFSSSEIVFHFNGPLKPVILKSEGADNHLHLLMPVKL